MRHDIRILTFGGPSFHVPITERAAGEEHKLLPLIPPFVPRPLPYRVFWAATATGQRTPCGPSVIVPSVYTRKSTVRRFSAAISTVCWRSALAVRLRWQSLGSPFFLRTRRHGHNPVRDRILQWRHHARSFARNLRCVCRVTIAHAARGHSDLDVSLTRR